MKMSKALALVSLLAASTASHAWWGGGPWNGLGNGVGDGAFNFSMSGSARGTGNGYGYNTPYWGGPYGYAPYAYAPHAYAPAVAPMPEEMARQQREAMEAQRNAAAEFRKQMEERHQAMRGTNRNLAMQQSTAQDSSNNQ